MGGSRTGPVRDQGHSCVALILERADRDPKPQPLVLVIRGCWFYRRRDEVVEPVPHELLFGAEEIC